MRLGLCAFDRRICMLPSQQGLQAVFKTEHGRHHAVGYAASVILDPPYEALEDHAGGNDVFVDVGNKSFGLEALMQYLGFQPSGVLHVGDRRGFPAGPHPPSGRPLPIWKFPVTSPSFMSFIDVGKK